jgi:hypothetical protein
MSEALDIQSEIDRMEVKILRFNILFQEEQSKNSNLTLISIALIGVIGVILDISKWFIKIVNPQDVDYPCLSIIKGIVIFTMLIEFLKRVLRNKLFYKKLKNQFSHTSK